MMLHIPAGFLARACGLSFLQTYALMRQMCSTGSDAAVSSFVIDDVATLIPKKGALGVSSPGGVLFCGQTKGDIRCFIGSREIKARSMQAHVDSSISRAGVAEASVPAGGGVPPCLVLRRQHGKDQVPARTLSGDAFSLAKLSFVRAVFNTLYSPNWWCRVFLKNLPWCAAFSSLYGFTLQSGPGLRVSSSVPLKSQ